MAAPLKDLYSPELIRRLADAIRAQERRFGPEPFVAAVMDASWPDLELKARMRRISLRLGEHLPGNYRRQLGLLQQVAPAFTGLPAMLFPDFVECHGLADPEASLPALQQFTRFSSSEFAIRPFILRYERETMARMQAWAHAEDEHVRRLASEGCRPRLPWAMALPRFKADPSPVLPILEALKADPSEYVRRSVANNLNDIAKDHPEVTLVTGARWLGVHPATDALVKHACRTLLKRGDTRALALFGYAGQTPVRVESFRVHPPRLRIGDTLEFSFVLVHGHPAPVRCRLEYHVQFVRASGRTSTKVFQIGERTLPGGRHHIRRRHAFVDRSTRLHHPGEHRLALAVNGVVQASLPVQLRR